MIIVTFAVTGGNYIFEQSQVIFGARGSVVVKALCYKPEVRGFESR
jgi:hypothetical protein